MPEPIRIRLRCTAAEHERWTQAAGPRGLSNLIRALLEEHVRSGAAGSGSWERAAGASQVRAAVLPEPATAGDASASPAPHPTPARGLARTAKLAEQRARRAQKAQKSLVKRIDHPALVDGERERLSQRPHHPMCRCFICRGA